MDGATAYGSATRRTLYASALPLLVAQLEREFGPIETRMVGEVRVIWVQGRPHPVFEVDGGLEVIL